MVLLLSSAMWGNKQKITFEWILFGGFSMTTYVHSSISLSTTYKS